LQRIRREKAVHRLFTLGVIGKGVDGALEILGGVLLLFVSPAQISDVVRMLTLHELSEDPHDLVANYLLHTANHLSAHAQFFGALYLLWHGAVKGGLVVALLHGRLWAYPVAIGAFLLFLVYQFYRYTHTHALLLLLLSALDIGVILLTWLEYQRVRAVRGY